MRHLIILFLALVSALHTAPKFTKPPAGSYFTTLVLYEFGSNKAYHWVDSLSTNSAYTFK